MDVFQQFLDKTTRSGFHNAVMAKVYEAEQGIERELNQKRDRLRTLLSMEDKQYTRTLLALQQQKSDDEFQKNYENLKKMENDREMERQKFVELKRKQQHLLNCHELRPKLRQTLLEDSKKAQLQQIEENRRLKQIEQDEEDMWHEIQRRTFEDKLYRERMEQSIRNERNACTVKYLDWQVANRSDGKGPKREEVEEERRQNSLKLEEMKRFDEDKRAELLQKQRDFARDCKMQIEASRIADQERRARDLNYDRMVSEFVRKELAASEAKKMSDKERRIVEYEHFLNYVEQQKIDSQLTEREQEELMSAYRRQVEEEAYKKRLQLREQQRILNEEVYAYQRKQMSENQEKNLRELEEKRQEQLQVVQTHRQNVEMEEAAMRAKRQQCNELRKKLMEQAQARELQLKNSKHDQQNEVQDAHVCDVDEVISLHPNFQQILSFNRK